MQLKIIIAGGRDFSNYAMLRKESLKIIREIVNGKIAKEQVIIISGGAKGADSLAVDFANEFGLQLQMFPADWEHLGRKAGYLRNVQMAEYASCKDEGNDTQNEICGILIAFWDGKSKGTNHMIEVAKKYHLQVHIVNY